VSITLLLGAHSTNMAAHPIMHLEVNLVCVAAADSARSLRP